MDDAYVQHLLRNGAYYTEHARGEAMELRILYVGAAAVTVLLADKFLLPITAESVILKV